MISMKILIVVLLSHTISGEDFKLDFMEEGSKYTETISIDNSSVLYNVPKHAQLEKAVHFYDYDAKMIAIRNYGVKKCYVYRMPNKSHNPKEIKEGLRKNGRESLNNFTVEHNYMVPLKQRTINRLPRKIKGFCGKFQVMKMEFFQNKTDADNKMFELENDANQKRMRRQILRFALHLGGCNRDDVCHMAKCRAYKIDVNGKKCQWSTSSCVYTMLCRWSPKRMDYSDCEKPKHRTSDIARCCYYHCNLPTALRPLNPQEQAEVDEFCK